MKALDALLIVACLAYVVLCWIGVYTVSTWVL